MLMMAMVVKITTYYLQCILYLLLMRNKWMDGLDGLFYEAFLRLRLHKLSPTLITYATFVGAQRELR